MHCGYLLADIKPCERPNCHSLASDSPSLIPAILCSGKRSRLQLNQCKVAIFTMHMASPALEMYIHISRLFGECGGTLLYTAIDSTVDKSCIVQVGLL